MLNALLFKNKLYEEGQYTARNIFIYDNISDYDIYGPTLLVRTRLSLIILKLKFTASMFLFKV